MKRRWILFPAFLTIIILGAYPVSSLLWAAPTMSSCEKCHTDESTLKALYKPPKVEAAAVIEAGEG